MFSRSLLAGVALLGACALLPAAPSDYLLIGQEEIEAAKRKAETHDWARRALDELLASAGKQIAAPIEIPSRGGQWPHWYSCKKDGTRLHTDSPTKHRCPVCGTVYTGDPYDAVVLYGIHARNSRAVRDLGLAFRFTGKAEYAARAVEILNEYAIRYKSYPRHDRFGEDKVGGGRVMAQTLDESVWLIPVAWGYALVRETMTTEDRARVENDLLVPAADVIRQHKLAIHNIQCWKNSAVGAAGFAAGRSDLVKEAIDDPERGFRAQIAKGVTDDGLWWEGSAGYHLYTMQALWPLAEAAQRAGIDLYSARYATLYEAPLALSLPNGDPPGFNDNAGSNVGRLAGLYELPFARWKKPAFGRLAASGSRESLEALLWGDAKPPAGPMIPQESTLLGASGFAVLRAQGTAVAVRFGMHGGGHGHPDKLGIVTFGGGTLFGLDPGSINYGVPLHTEWYKSTIAHNTVAVDGANQGHRDGALEDWTAGAVTTLAASAGAVYPGVTLRRSLKLSPGRLEDRFECASESEHTYDWAFHAPGRLTVSLETSPREEPLGQSHGYQHIRGVAETRTDAEWWARWENGAARLTMRFKAAPGTEVFTGSGPGRNPEDKVPLIVVRRRAAKTTFEVVHEMGAVR